ncbi:MAG: septum site-determining protein MinC [Syntrophomonadaceae bacterium]|nr:septum site-determining protein MinC [Syntrophomonadaceae bacterium]
MGVIVITEDVVIRESQGGIIICLNSQDSFPDLKQQLLDKLKAFDDLLIGVQVVLDVGQRKLKKTEVLELKEMLLEQGLHLKKLISRGKSVDLTGKGGQVEVVNTPTTTLKNQEIGSIEETILVKRTLRSGQRVFFPGNVVVLGDVNPGAEVIAGGNVLIMGSMRGMVHAGALGSEDAVVAAFRLNPTQLRIANHITRPPEGQASKGNEPEIASIKSGKVIIEDLKL